MVTVLTGDSLLAAQTTVMFLKYLTHKWNQNTFFTICIKSCLQKAHLVLKVPQRTLCSVPRLTDEPNSQCSLARAAPHFPACQAEWDGLGDSWHHGAVVRFHLLVIWGWELLILDVKGTVSNSPVGKEGSFHLLPNSTFRLLTFYWCALSGSASLADKVVCPGVDQ